MVAVMATVLRPGLTAHATGLVGDAVDLLRRPAVPFVVVVAQRSGMGRDARRRTITAARAFPLGAFPTVAALSAQPVALQKVPHQRPKQ